MQKTASHPSKQTDTVILWGLGVSPYVRKVQIALEEKNIPYEHKPILPKALLTATHQAIPSDFEQASPLGKIPALQVGDFCMADSSVITAYLDKKYDQGQQLYPQCPESYARTRWFENYADTIFSAVAYQKIFLEAVVKPKVLGIAPDMEMVRQAKNTELPPLLDYLESEVEKRPWLAGNDFSMADVALVTHFISLEQAGWTLSESRWKSLAEYYKKVIGRKSFQRIA